MTHSKKRARRQSTEVFDFDPVAIAMEAAEEVTGAAIDPIVPDSQQATTGEISPAIDSTQLVDNARGAGHNNIQQEDGGPAIDTSEWDSRLGCPWDQFQL
ncbi:hypothetical protein R1flu_002183 [Riccia fluitans]|uniref:Uncharacterized protein n=1 Tax=Riccia fluitans TaxID=41844 RepID=A0ABD1Y5N7_9MARC